MDVGLWECAHQAALTAPVCRPDRRAGTDTGPCPVIFGPPFATRFAMPPLPLPSETLSFANAAGQLYYHPAGHVRVAWGPGRVPLDAVQALYEKALTVLLTTGARKILSEHGQRAPLLPVTQQWITQNWIPRVVAQAQARQCALVEGADPVHRLSTETVVLASPAGFIYKRFAIRAEAEAWLAGLRL